MHAECAKLIRSGKDREVRFLLEQMAMFQPTADIPELITLLMRSGDNSAVAGLCAAIGKYRAPEEVAAVVGLLNMNRCLRKRIPEILTTAARRTRPRVTELELALRTRSLPGFAGKLAQQRLAPAE